MTRPASINDVLQLLGSALRELGALHSPRQVEMLGALVHEAMSLDFRHYHDVTHAVTVAQDGDAIEKLAGLFHDVVYFQVDHELASILAPLIEPFVEIEDGCLKLAARACADDRWVQIALEVFGFSIEDDRPPQSGLNELLSAIVAAKAMQELLSARDLVQVLVCIEATIPFRAHKGPGLQSIDALAQRLSRVNEQFALGLDEAAMERSVVRAVNVSNWDVASFARDDITEFLAETWLLFAESNPVLARKRGFLIGDYRRSLIGAIGFFQRLDPNSVFVSYRGVPEAKILQGFESRLRKNLERGAVYLKMKIVGIALLEGLAQLTGGDTLVAMFMGQVRFGEEYGERLEDYLTSSQGAAPGESAPDSSPVYQLLAQGRAAASRFDMPNSPLSAFMHDRLGEAGLLALYPHAESMVAGEITPKTFLRHVRKDVLCDIVKACQQIAWTRAERLEEVLTQLKHGASSN